MAFQVSGAANEKPRAADMVGKAGGALFAGFSKVAVFGRPTVMVLVCG